MKNLLSRLFSSVFSFVKDTKNLKTIIIVVLAIILAIILFRGCGDSSGDQNAEIVSLEQELQKWKNKDSLNMAKIEVYKATNAKAFLALKSSDEEVQFLQGEISRYTNQLKKGGSVTVVETVTQVDTVIKTTKVVEYETIIVNDTAFIAKEYVTELNTSWVTGTVRNNPDYLILDDLKIKNKYTVAIGSEKPGLFKKRRYFSEVTNFNPMSETKTLKTFSTTGIKQKRFGIGPSVQAGYDVRDMADFDFNTDNIKFTVGISVHWSLIRF